jgi:hypothetical protein
VERLQMKRGESIRVEGETYRKLLRGNDGSEGRKELPGGKTTPVITVKTRN